MSKSGRVVGAATWLLKRNYKRTFQGGERMKSTLAEKFKCGEFEVTLVENPDVGLDEVKFVMNPADLPVKDDGSVDDKQIEELLHEVSAKNEDLARVIELMKSKNL